MTWWHWLLIALNVYLILGFCISLWLEIRIRREKNPGPITRELQQEHFARALIVGTIFGVPMLAAALLAHYHDRTNKDV